MKFESNITNANWKEIVTNKNWSNPPAVVRKIYGRIHDASYFDFNNIHDKNVEGATEPPRADVATPDAPRPEYHRNKNMCTKINDVLNMGE